RSSPSSSSATSCASPPSTAGRTTSPPPSSTATTSGRTPVTRRAASSASAGGRRSSSRPRSCSCTPRLRLQTVPERREAEHRDLHDRLEEDRAAHLRMARGAVDEADRHLDDAKALLERPVRPLDLERVALGVDGAEVDRLEHPTRVALEPAGQVVDPDAEHRACVERAAPGDDPSAEAPVLRAAAGDVAGAE